MNALNVLSYSNSNMSPPARSPRPQPVTSSLIQWIDADYPQKPFEESRNDPDTVDWVRAIPFLFLHAGCLGVLWVGWSWTAVAVAFFLYGARMFAITGFYHRYFSHRTFRTGRKRQFLFAFLGATSAQRGPLWWAYQHRHHHRHSDEPEDPHSPKCHGFLWSHIGWITSRRNFPTDYGSVRDLSRYPELVFLNRFDIVAPLTLAAALLFAGSILNRFAPSLGTSGPQLLVWGFFISTTALFHATSSINSLAHLMGRRRYATEDSSRNSFLLALITLGEGWHNNHHRFMSATRQGFYWWEIDITYYLLLLLERTGIISDLRPVPEAAYIRNDSDSTVPPRARADVDTTA